MTDDRAAGVSAFFSSSYADARSRFMTACEDIGVRVTSYRNPRAPGPGGGALSTDVARIGPDETDKVFVVVSGTHGVEGFCGSGCQIGYLRQRLDKELPPKTALVLVHALNPYGFAYLRRVNEDNVDLNRNFIDHDQPAPANPGYDEIHDLLVPADWGGSSHAAADRAIGEVIAARGLRAVQAAITRGQYDHPGGLFYGGRRAVWSNDTWRQIIRTYVAGHRHVAFVDLHSGLGRYGYGEPIFRGRFERGGYRRARDWYGESVTCSEDGSSSSTEIVGNVASALAAEVGDAELTAITLEFGTLQESRVLNALRADHWLHVHGHAAGPSAEAIKMGVRDAFYCDNGEWKRLIWERSLEIFRRTAAGLEAS